MCARVDGVIAKVSSAPIVTFAFVDHFVPGPRISQTVQGGGDEHSRLLDRGSRSLQSLLDLSLDQFSPLPRWVVLSSAFPDADDVVGTHFNVEPGGVSIQSA